MKEGTARSIDRLPDGVTMVLCTRRLSLVWKGNSSGLLGLGGKSYLWGKGAKPRFCDY